MAKRMIGLAAVFVVACTGQVEDVSHLDAQLTSDGVYGTYEQGEVRLEFASFELEPGVFAVTVVGDGLDIDTLIMPPGKPRPVPSNRSTVLVDLGPDYDDSLPDFGAKLVERFPEMPTVVTALLRALGPR